MRQLRLRHLKLPVFRCLLLVYDAFNEIRRRPSPDPKTKTRHLRLITILYSHFCEKGRWALELLEDDPTTPYYFTEDCHPPGLHYLETVRASKDQGSVTPMVIVSDTDQVILKSTNIIRQFLPSLYPTDEVSQLEELYNQDLGAAIRVWFYDLVLTDEFWPMLVSVSKYGCSWIEKALFPYMKTEILGTLRKDLVITQDTSQLSKETLRKVFADASKRLESREYLAGNEFTAADLTFCALSSPLLRPPELAKFHCHEGELPTEALEFMKELRATKAGQHVLKVYKYNRGSRLVELRAADRNRIPWIPITSLFAGITALFWLRF
jgi:glutathione S-transferase